MAGSPLDKIRRDPNAPKPQRPQPPQPVAPYWVGRCLRMAGEAAVPAVVFRKRDGARTAISYSYLAAVEASPEGAITIEFVGHTVSITGRRLGQVFEALAAQRALELAESASEFDEGGGEPEIETIAVVAVQER